MLSDSITVLRHCNKLLVLTLDSLLARQFPCFARLLRSLAFCCSRAMGGSWDVNCREQSRREQSENLRRKTAHPTQMPVQYLYLSLVPPQPLSGSPGFLQGRCSEEGRSGQLLAERRQDDGLIIDIDQTNCLSFYWLSTKLFLLNTDSFVLRF